MGQKLNETAGTAGTAGTELRPRKNQFVLRIYIISDILTLDIGLFAPKSVLSVGLFGLKKINKWLETPVTFEHVYRECDRYGQ